MILVNIVSSHHITHHQLIIQFVIQSPLFASRTLDPRFPAAAGSHRTLLTIFIPRTLKVLHTLGYPE
jgi:hypothetical protein